MSETVALWAVPRSVSTALEKSLSRHPAIAPVHEPFTDCYYFSAARRSSRYGDQPHKVAYGMADVERLLGATGTPVTLIKDLCFQAEPYLPPERLSTWTNIFVIRHPARVWTSLSRLKADFTEEEFGFTALERMWARVTGDLGHPELLVDGDRFRQQPEATLRQLCARIGLEFDPRMLEWASGRIKAWSADENDSQEKWHRMLESSHTILQPEPALPADWKPEGAGRDRLRIYDNAVAIHDRVLKQGGL